MRSDLFRPLGWLRRFFCIWHGWSPRGRASHSQTALRRSAGMAAAAGKTVCNREVAFEPPGTGSWRVLQAVQAGRRGYESSANSPRGRASHRSSDK